MDSIPDGAPAVLKPLASGGPAGLAHSLSYLRLYRGLLYVLHYVLHSFFHALRPLLIPAKADGLRRNRNRPIGRLATSVAGWFSRASLAFDGDLNAFVRRAEEKNRPLSLLMLDLDKFKAANDQHGHQIGDEVSRAAGGTM